VGKKPYRVMISVARPVRPRNILSVTGKIYEHVCSVMEWDRWKVMVMAYLLKV